jgi:cytidine deaminase
VPEPQWTEIHEKALAMAWRARSHAWAPYSGFKVGCALIFPGGEIVPGCNVENASYGLTQCAERCAVCAAVARGLLGFTDAIVVTDLEEPAPPCGACRQVLFEFSPGATVWLVGSGGGKSRHIVGELLPEAFRFDGPGR